MFDKLITQEEPRDIDSLNFDFKRVWRLCSRMTSGRQSKSGKGVIFNTITPNAFDIRPSDIGVSLNKLDHETDSERNDSISNRAVMSKKIKNSENESKCACLFLDRNGFDDKLQEDPLSRELMKRIKIERSADGEFTHNRISACHYDLFYYWIDGSVIDGKSPHVKSDELIQLKRFVCEAARIPQHSLMDDEEVIVEDKLFKELFFNSVVGCSTDPQ